MKIIVTRSGQQFGPYSLFEANHYVQTGQLSPNDLCWYDGANSWLPLSTILHHASQNNNVRFGSGACGWCNGKGYIYHPSGDEKCWRCNGSGVQH